MILAAVVMVYGIADAKVSGECVNCHTMHNSQNGEPMAVSNTNGWDGSALTGDPQEAPNGGLLVTDCIGCHSASDAETIKHIGNSDIPIVRNMVAPTTPLAGGNFYYSEAGLATGHDVTQDDPNGLLYGPGLPLDFAGLDPAIPGSTGHCAGSCHNKLHNPVRSGNALPGCRGCHYETFHHADPGAFPGGVDNSSGSPVLISGDYSVDPTYRFLTGHHYWGRISGGNVVTEPGVFVEGVEDSDWEYTVSSTDHNIYLGYAGTPGIINATNRSISAFCTACHEHFHTEMGSASSAWLRHPVNVTLPTSGEYAAYDYATAYSPEAPVAFVDTSDTTTGGQVACVSCHRAHGSPNDDMLRWDYSGMIAAGGGSGGCFTCHTTKDNP
ncbi:MAG: cytochrome c [Thermodesulfovibrionales bacterium]